MHFSRIRTVRCSNHLGGGVVSARGVFVTPPPRDQNHRSLRKHTLAATTLRTVKNACNTPYYNATTRCNSHIVCEMTQISKGVALEINEKQRPELES